MLSDNKKIFFLSGLKRTGSTLLGSILSQNKNIFVSGNSPLLQIMWEANETIYSTDTYASIMANSCINECQDIIKEMPKVFYKNKDYNFIIDKNPYWAHPNNFKLIKEYIDKNPKIIIMVRDIRDVTKSIFNIYKENNINFDQNNIFSDNKNAIVAQVDGIEWAKNNNQNNNFLFIDYEELVINTENIIKKIYNFYEIKKYDHSFDFIENKNKENDEYYGLKNLHKVRPQIIKRSINIDLNRDIVEECNFINKKINDLLWSKNEK